MLIKSPIPSVSTLLLLLRERLEDPQYPRTKLLFHPQLVPHLLLRPPSTPPASLLLLLLLLLRLPHPLLLHGPLLLFHLLGSLLRAPTRHPVHRCPRLVGHLVVPYHPKRLPPPLIHFLLRALQHLCACRSPPLVRRPRRRGVLEETTLLRALSLLDRVSSRPKKPSPRQPTSRTGPGRERARLASTWAILAVVSLPPWLLTPPDPLLLVKLVILDSTLRTRPLGLPLLLELPLLYFRAKLSDSGHAVLSDRDWAVPAL